MKLEKLTLTTVQKHLDEMYEIALDITKTCYPYYGDGIKTKEDFVQLTLSSFHQESNTVLGFFRNEVLIGWVHTYFIEESNYVSTHSMGAQEDFKILIKLFYDWVINKYPKAQLVLGFSSHNSDAITSMKVHHFELIESSTHFVQCLKTKSSLNNNVVPLKLDEFSSFQSIHDAITTQMYWTSERILNTFDRWIIYVYKEEGKVLASIYLNKTNTMMEVYGVDFLNNEWDTTIYRQLLSKVVSNHTGYLTYLASPKEAEVLRENNFKEIGEYHCYQLQL